MITNGDLTNEFERMTLASTGVSVEVTQDIMRALWVGQRLGQTEGAHSALISSADELDSSGRFDSRPRKADREYADWLRARAAEIDPAPAQPQPHIVAQATADDGESPLVEAEAPDAAPAAGTIGDTLFGLATSEHHSHLTQSFYRELEPLKEWGELPSGTTFHGVVDVIVDTISGYTSTGPVAATELPTLIRDALEQLRAEDNEESRG